MEFRRFVIEAEAMSLRIVAKIIIIVRLAAINYLIEVAITKEVTVIVKEVAEYFTTMKEVKAVIIIFILKFVMVIFKLWFKQEELFIIIMYLPL